MNCPNKSHPSWIKMIEKYGEEQALLKWIKNGEQFENIIDIKPGVEELFESNQTLANSVYEALGFNNVITPNDKIVWGHPAIGKTTMLESNPNAFIDWDNEFNRKRDTWIADKSNTVIGTQEFKKARNEYMINYNNHRDYVAFVTNEWNKAKEKANKENKILIASPHMLLNLFPNDFDKVITMNDKTFMDRAVKRSGGDEVNSKLWKEGINKTLQSIDKSKIIETDKFINDLFITPQQKQQALQIYSQYLDSLNKPNTNPILQGNQKPDVILPIGTSGSGKSTFIKSLSQENLVVIEPDAMRVEFTGDMNNKSKDKEIYIEAANRAIQAIKQGKQVVFDTTNLTKDKRLPFIEAIKKAIPTANIQYKLMELNPELAKQRIKAQLEKGENRAAVSDETIDRHAESYKQMLEDIKSEPISNYDIQQEQVKKFTELQERLNNKEFLEGAKFAYESTPELQQFGTQEQYNDYIARVSLGIIKNPSSGDYNYTSKVKDIVYHFSNTKIDKPDKEKFSLSANINRRKGFFGINKNVNPGNNFANVEGTIPHAMLFNMKNPDFGDFSVLPPIVAKNETKDSAIIKQRGDINYYAVFEPEQIHILSSKADVEGFKDWVSNSKLSDSNQQNNNSSNIFFNTLNSNEAKKVDEFDRFVEKEMLKVLKSLGLKVTGVRKQFSYDNVPNTATAFFDATNWLVEYHRGRATKETLPEEGAHAYLWLYRMYDQEGYDDLLAKALEEYKDRFDENSFMNTPEEHQFEILGRILRDKLLDKLENKYKEGGIWDKILNFILDIFNISGTTAEEIMNSMAENILNYNGNILEDLQDNIDKTYTKFTESFVKVEEFEQIPNRDNKYFVKSRNTPKIIFDPTNINSLLMYAKYRDEVNKKTSKIILPDELQWRINRKGVDQYIVDYLKREIENEKKFFQLNSKINELFKNKRVTEFNDWTTYRYVFKLLLGANIKELSEFTEYTQEQWLQDIMGVITTDVEYIKMKIQLGNIDNFDTELKEMEEYLDWLPDYLEDGIANNYDTIKEFAQLLSENVNIVKQIIQSNDPYFYYMKRNKNNYIIKRAHFNKMIFEYDALPKSKIIERVSMRDIFQGKKSYMFEGQNLNKPLYDNRVYKIFERSIGGEKVLKNKINALKQVGKDLFKMQQLLPIVNAHNKNVSAYDDKFGPRREFQHGDFLPAVTTDGFVVMSDDYSDRGSGNIYFNTIEDVGQKGEDPVKVNDNVNKTIAELDLLQNTFVKDRENSGQYINKITKEKTTKTVTTIRENTIKREETELDEMRKQIGTDLGELYQSLFKDIYEGKEPSYDKNYQFFVNALLPSIHALVNEINERQELINDIYGTKDKAIVRLEQVLIDESRKFKEGKGLGGSTDILVIFSNNTAAIYDLKTMFTAGFIGEEGNVNNIIIADRKKESYKFQIHEYSKMLKKRTGVETVIKRIVPIIANLDEKKKLTISVEDKEGVLRNIIVGNEKIGIDVYDRWLKRRFALIDTLNKNIQLLKNKSAKENKSYFAEIVVLKNKINGILKSIEKAYINNDILSTINTSYTLEKEIRLELKKSLEEIDMDRIEEMVEEMETILDIQNVSYELSKLNDPLPEEEQNKINYRLGALQNVLTELKNIRDLKAVEYWKAQNLVQTNTDKRLVFNVKQTKEDNAFVAMLGNISDQSNPFIQKIYKNFLELNAKETFERQNYIKELRKYSALSGVNQIIDKEKGTLINKFDNSTTKYLDELIVSDREKAAKEILKHYDYKNYNEEEIIKEIQEMADKIFVIDKEYRGNTTEEQKQTQRNMKNFIKNQKEIKLKYIEDDNGNRKLNIDGVISSYKLRLLELKDETKYYSKEYRALPKDIKEAYDWFYKWNIEFRRSLGIEEYRYLPTNFIPLMRKDLIDKWKDNNLGDFVKYTISDLMDSLGVLPDDTEFGEIDASGNVKKKIPILFLRTQNNKKNVENNMSFDLFSTFDAFSKFAFHYKAYEDVENKVYALRQLLLDKAFTNNGKVEITSRLIEQFDDYVNYYVYGMKLYKSDADDLIKGSNVSLTKVLNSLNNMEGQRQLGFNVLSSTASHIAGRTSILIEATKGNMFTLENHNRAVKDMVSNRTNYLAFAGFFNIYPDADAHRMGLDPHEHHWLSDNHPDRIKKYIGSRNSILFKSWQWGEEDVTNVVTISMGQNYGIDENGNVKRLEFLPKDSKSLYDTMEYSDGKISFKNYKGDKVENLEKVYAQFRQIARAGIRNTVGTANEQDMARYKMYLAGRLLMKYRTWMPGVLLERLRDTRVNEYAQVIETGRYRALLGSYYDLDKIKKNKFEILYMTAQLARDFSLNLFKLGSIVGQNFYQIDRNKAKLEFEKWKEEMREENPYEIEKLEQLTSDPEKQLDLFIRAKQGQLIASLNEIRILVGLLGLILLLGMVAGGADDDDYKTKKGIEKLIRLTDKVRTEIGFLLSIPSYTDALERPLPIVSVLGRLLKTLGNTYDEGKDTLFGEDTYKSGKEKKDETPVFHYTKTWIAGHKILELFNWMWE